MAITSGVCPTATNPSGSPATAKCGDRNTQTVAGFGACDAAKTSPSAVNSTRSSDSR